MTRSILDQVRELGIRVNDPYMDGFYSLACKQQLYQILWETQRQLSKCGEFATEKEWVEANKPKEENNNGV
jgi:hypothetical protein